MGVRVHDPRERRRAGLLPAPSERGAPGVGIARAEGDVRCVVLQLDAEQRRVSHDDALVWRRGRDLDVQSLRAIDVREHPEAIEVAQQVEAVRHTLLTVGVRGPGLVDRQPRVEPPQRIEGREVAQEVAAGGAELDARNHKETAARRRRDCCLDVADVVVVGNRDDLQAVALRGSDEPHRGGGSVPHVVGGRIAVDVHVGAKEMRTVRQADYVLESRQNFHQLLSKSLIATSS